MGTFTTRYVYEKTINMTGNGVATTTWDPAAKNASINLTNGNLTATDNTTGGFQAVRAIASQSSGKRIFKVHIDVFTSNHIVGIANATESLSFAPGVLDANGIGLAADGQVWCNGVNPTGSPVSVFAVGDDVWCAVNIDGMLIWWKTNAGNWNNNGSANPATGVGGINMTTAGLAAGPYFPMIAFTGAVGEAMTADFAPASPPSGFGNW
jgi:hypothetical protein